MARWVHQQALALVPNAATQVQVAEIAAALEQPPEASLGDYALPCFRLAKPLAMKPQAVADALQAASGDADGWIVRKQTAGAFLNFFINQPKMAATVVPAVADHSWFKQLGQDAARQATKVMIEYSQPNTHKEFHVGHGRNVCLGDSLVRIFRYCGFQVIAANYPGDEGAHIAKCLWFIRSRKQTPPATNRGEWLGEMYAESTRILASLEGDARKQADAEISQVLRAIESKQGEIYKQWQETRQWSLEDFYATYDWLGVKFDQYFFESELSEDSQTIVDEFLQKQLFVESDGAIGMDLKPYKLGFLILRKSDGNTLYATKDLVLARRKFDDFRIDRSVYVVAAEQNLHFKQVFKALELMGFEQAKQCFHLSYGMVVLPDGKMSSRAGNSVTFRSLREAIEVELSQQLDKYKDEWSAAELAEAKHRLCNGAIRYGMLGTDPVKNVVFKLEDWVSFDGDSGPYLMYSYARTRSIIRKAATEGLVPDATNLMQLKAPEEAELVRYIFDFNQVVASACDQYKPSLIAHHLFNTCKSFNRFYANVSVLKAESKSLVGARLALVDAFSTTLSVGLNLLGIQPPERM